MKFWFRTAISVILASSLASADETAVTPARALAAHLEQVDNVVTSFAQTIVSADGVVLEESTGTLYLQKPFFRWDVDDPYPQIVIARQDDLQLYDPDLEQVTVKRLSESLDDAPLALLTRTGLNLSEYFDVVQLGSDGELAEYELYPVASDALFQRLRLAFTGERLVGLTIFDHVGQQTLIRFAQYATEQVIQSEVFELEYPSGTDIVRG